MKLTKYQLFWLVFSMEIGMSIMLTIGPTFKEAKQGAPLAMILAGIASLFITFIAIKLSLLYPEHTFVEFVPKIVGKWLGNAIVIGYLLIWALTAGIALRQYADFVQMALFSLTPLWIIILCMLLAVVYAVHAGIDVVGRCGEVIGPIIIFNILLFRLLSIRDIHFENLLPLLPPTGWIPMLRGSTTAASSLCESVMIVMLVAFLKDKSKALGTTLWSVGIVGLILLNSIIDVLSMLGETVPGKFQYPVYSISQYVSFMEFIQSFDIFLVVGVSCTLFIKVCLYLFMSSYGTAQILHIQKWRNLLWIVGFIVFIVALFPRNIDQSQVTFLYYWKSIVFPIFLLGIPLLLWLIGSTKKRMSKS